MLSPYAANSATTDQKIKSPPQQPPSSLYAHQFDCSSKLGFGLNQDAYPALASRAAKIIGEGSGCTSTGAPSFGLISTPRMAHGQPGTGAADYRSLGIGSTLSSTDLQFSGQILSENHSIHRTAEPYAASIADRLAPCNPDNSFLDTLNGTHSAQPLNGRNGSTAMPAYGQHYSQPQHTSASLSVVASSVNSTPYQGHASIGGMPQMEYSSYASLLNKANLMFDSNLELMCMDWTLEERDCRRRLVQFWRRHEENNIFCTFKAVAAADRVPNSIVVSCIYWEEKRDFFITSVDCIYLLESLISVRFTVEEKNRIRRNLEGFRPLTVSKCKAESAEFFKLIMSFPNPKPRNIEKDVKVFPWRILPLALKKIISKYTASYSSTASTGADASSMSRVPGGPQMGGITLSAPAGGMMALSPSNAQPTQLLNDSTAPASAAAKHSMHLFTPSPASGSSSLSSNLTAMLETQAVNSSNVASSAPGAQPNFGPYLGFNANNTVHLSTEATPMTSTTAFLSSAAIEMGQLSSATGCQSIKPTIAPAHLQNGSSDEDDEQHAYVVAQSSEPISMPGHSAHLGLAGMAIDSPMSLFGASQPEGLGSLSIFEQLAASCGLSALDYSMALSGAAAAAAAAAAAESGSSGAGSGPSTPAGKSQHVVRGNNSSSSSSAKRAANAPYNVNRSERLKLSSTSSDCGGQKFALPTAPTRASTSLSSICDGPCERNASPSVPLIVDQSTHSTNRSSMVGLQRDADATSASPQNAQFALPHPGDFATTKSASAPFCDLLQKPLSDTAYLDCLAGAKAGSDDMLHLGLSDDIMSNDFKLLADLIRTSAKQSDGGSIDSATICSASPQNNSGTSGAAANLEPEASVLSPSASLTKSAPQFASALKAICLESMNSKAPGAAASMTPTATADPAVRSEHAFEARIHSDSRASTPEIEEALGRPAPGSPTSESYIDEPHSAELYTYLREAPRNYNYLLTPAARKSILRRVSWYLLSRDDRLADLVPLDERTGGAPREELQDEVEVPIEYTEVRRGQPCGHVFKRGEGVYRCKNCSIDDTCVLCTRCFQAGDHAGHDTSFSINSGTGGCCDCGDPEAWKIPLRCRHHSSFEELEECGMEPIVSSAGAPFVPGYKTNNNGCPASVRRSIGLTIAVVLEFILESFATSPINLTAQFDEHTIIEDAHNAGLAIGDHEKQEQFAIVLWNDEVHSYQDVIDQCTEALQCSQIEAKRIAKAVDTCGRDVLRVSASIPELIDIATTMTNVSLSVSIRAARDIFREQLSASLLIWLRDLACCKFRPLARVFSGKINNEIRSEISYQLCLRWVAPYRNPYLADILERMYDYNLLESEFGDEDDAMEEDDQEYYEDDDEGYRHVGDQEMGSVDAAYNTTMPVAQPNANQAHSMYAYPIDSSGDAAAYRGLRRRRSESEDSLQHEGEERASPRGFMQGRSEDNDDIPPSMWLAENNTPSTIHAAMGAAAGAVDAARLSLARIMQPDPTANYPPHSAAPGAYPNSAVLTESESEVPVQEAVHSASATQLVQDPVLAQDMQTAQSIERVLRGCGQQRLDWFLIFDLQLWKEVRSGLRELYMATLMLDSRYKMKIALTFARNYPRLSRAFLTQDRAPEHSVLLFSVQLFTAPTLSASLVEHHYFLYIILDVLKKFFMDPTPEFLRHCGVTLCDTGSFRNRRYFHVFHDMRYLAGTPQVRNWVSIHHRFLASYVGFIGLFQGMNPNCRAILQHVEFEADTWVNAFNVTLQVAKSCRQFAECYGISARDLFFAIRGTLRTIRRSVMLMAEENSAPIIRSGQVHGYLPQAIANPVNSGGEIGDAPQLTFETHVLQTLWGRQYEVVKYDVSSCPVSFHHPLHWFMAEMFQHVKHLTDERARDFGFASIRDMVFSAFDTQLDTALEVFAETTADSSSVSALHTVGGNDMAAAQLELLRILDYPIRVCVVMAQIRAGLWVRNGYVIRLQSHHYREVSLRENTYDQDIVMIQFFLSIWPDTDHILMTLLDRFELYDWFSGRIQQSQVYEPFHLQYMVEEFLNLLIVVMSERHVATGKNALDLARREIVHGCLSPISYSELSKKVPERLAENTEFDNLLQKMADYRGPTGIMDFGQYELKDEFLDEVDPYFIHYSHNQREEVEEVLRERLKKRMRKQGSTEDVPEYLPPKLEPIRFGPFQRIGMLLHTPLACQVLFHALLHATQTPAGLLSETMVDEALQLIVLALEDGQRGAVAREIGGIDIGNASSEQAASGTAVDRGGLWKYALEQGYPAGRGTPMNLLGLVLTLGLKPEMKQWKHKLDHIYHLFRQGGPRIVSCIDDYYANLEATPMGSRVLNSAIEETKAAERKKEAAKARQAAIMAEFANQQQQFMSQFGDEFDDLSDDEDDAVVNPEATVASADGKGKSAETTRVHRPLWGAPTGACIVCQEECDSLRPYGMLGIIQANRLVRTAPLADASQVVDILRLPGGLDMRTSEPNSAMQQGHSGMLGALPVKGISHSQTAEQLQTLNFISAGAYGANSGLKKFPVTYHKRGMAASTCGHMMHVKCFTQYCQGIELKRRPHPTRNHPENLHRKEFLCPLCKSLGNVLLPALPGVADYDPLSTIDSERFTIESPAKKAELFEHWLEDEWKPFGEALSLACSKQSDSSSSASSSSVDSAASNTPADNTTASGDTQTSTGSHQHALQLSSADSGAAAQHPSTFPFNFAEGLTDSIPRLDEFIRNAPLMTGGLGLQTLISRLLPQLTGSNMVAAQGPERLALPLSRYVRWLVERQALDAGHHHHRRHFNSRPGGGGDDSSRVSTPDTSAVPSAGAAFAEHHSSSEVEARYREQMEGFHCMYSRLYDVLQNVQRDNHVGLPAPSLFEHLSRSKDRGSTSASPAHGQQDSEPAVQEEAMADKSDPSEEIEDEDFMACTTPAGATETTGSNRFMYEPSPTALPPFLQNFLDQIRGFGAVNGPQPISAAPTNNNGASGQLQHGKGRLYPFDRAAAELFTYTIELLELSQRGARNPPVFNHEDSRTLPSGTLTDAVPETLATFLHLLGKIPELHYRIMFDTSLQVASAEEKSSTPARPPERLRALIKESRLQANSATAAAAAAATASDSATVGVTNETIARTRLDMLQDIANTLAPLIKPVFARSCEFVNELSQWHLGGEVAITRPFLMQDMYALLSELSLSLVGPFGLDIWHLTRLLLTAELVRICVAVGDSVLGEYSGAPKALRIAHSLPLGAESYHSDSPCISQQSGRVPQPWVDAPEARDVSQLSSQSDEGDTAMLESSAPSIHALVMWAIRQVQGSDLDSGALERLKRSAHPVTVTKLVATLLLPFLRQVALMFNIQHGLDIAREAPWLSAERHRALGNDSSITQVLSQDIPECTRLLKLLNLPDLPQLFDPETQPGTLEFVEGWLRDLRVFRRRHASPMSLGAGYTMAVPVNMPTPYSLVELPERFEVLFERSAKAFCPRCNGVPSEPALCLLCGNFVCVQSFCCQEDGIGECNMHMKTCGGTIGVFLQVKKCGLVLLHHDNGCFMSAPYLDQHGEVDLGLKRGRPLFLAHDRYEEMRRLVLTQKIPIFIARKIEQSFDIGGWVSL